MDYLKELENSKQEMIDTLADSISIKSVLAPAAKGKNGEVYPFGEGIEKAYEHIMSVGEKMGFEVKDFDHYGGHIELSSPDSDETFAIVGHLDVVPEGEGWDTDPYEPVIKDNWMHGRGTTDDKGPLISCLYAMKAIKDAGIVPKKNIRLIVGLDEETEKEGMVYYLEKAGMPDMGITPDGDFPLINGEMGILIFDIAQKLKKHSKKDGLILRKMESGTAPNIVPGTAKAVIASEDAADYDKIAEIAKAYAAETGYDLKTKKSGSSLSVEAHGIAAHGARPSTGLNSVSIMMGFLGRLQFASEELNEFIMYYNEHIGFNLSGEKIGCAFEDGPSGKLIFNVGMAEINEDIASVTINIRYPVSNTDAEVYAGIEETMKGTGIGIVKKTQESPVFIPLDDPFVKKLMEAYVEVTGDTVNKPQVIGGGTYAKLMSRVLAYGAAFPGEEDRMHQANERLDLDSYEKMAQIYAKTIYKICCE